MNAPAHRPNFLTAVPETGVPRAPSFVPASRSSQRAAHAPGRQQGPSQDELNAIRAEALEKVSHAVEVLRLSSERLAEQARSDALEIGFLVARRILETEISASPEPLFALVRGCIRKVGESRRVVARLNPEDVPLLKNAAQKGEAGITTAQFEVVADASIARGDCVVDTDFGTVDGRLSTRLEELYRAARAALEEGQA